MENPTTPQSFITEMKKLVKKIDNIGGSMTALQFDETMTKIQEVFAGMADEIHQSMVMKVTSIEIVEEEAAPVDPDMGDEAIVEAAIEEDELERIKDLMTPFETGEEAAKTKGFTHKLAVEFSKQLGIPHKTKGGKRMKEAKLYQAILDFINK